MLFIGRQLLELEGFAIRMISVNETDEESNLQLPTLVLSSSGHQD